MELILRKFGNSTGVALPPSILKNLGLKAGQPLTVSATTAGGVLLTPIRRYTRAQLLAMCNAKAPIPDDLAL
jgi:antitoxin ChpS